MPFDRVNAPGLQSQETSRIIRPVLDSTIAHYKVTAKLGQGGMGEVYSVTDSTLDREVAIKVTTHRPERSERWNLRQVLECGNGACDLAAFGLESARLDSTMPLERADAKAVNSLRSAQHSKTLARGSKLQSAMTP